MLKVYRRRLIIGLVLLLLVFGIIFLSALLASNRGYGLLGLGIPFSVENFLIMVLSFIAMVKVVWEIYRVEHPDRKVY